MLNNAQNQPSKFRINDNSGGTYNTNSQIIFKTSLLKSRLCDYSNAYILVKGTIAIPNTAGAGNAVNNIAKKVIHKNCASFTDCISEINNKQVDNATDIDAVMPMYNLIEYSDNYSNTSGSSWQYCKDKAAVNDANGDIIDVNVANTVTNSFKFKQQITCETGNGGTKDVDIIVPLKYLSILWRAIEMPLINCEINLILTWSAILRHSVYRCRKSRNIIFNK